MTKVEKLAKYLKDNLSAQEGYKRGEANVYWKEEEVELCLEGIEVCEDRPYLKMAKDITKHLSKAKKGKTGERSNAWKGGENREKKRIKDRLYNKTHRALRSYNDMIRRMRLRNIEGSFTRGQWKDLKKKYNYRCVICGEKEPFENQYFKYLTEDHIIPLSRGGSNFIDNIQPLCHKCNCLKRNNFSNTVTLK